MMPASSSPLSRGAVCGAIFSLAALLLALRATASSTVVVHKDPNWGCCGAWAKHLEAAGLSVKIEETTRQNVVRSRLGVPTDLAACHTAEVGGYLVEGHVPAAAIKRLIEEGPDASGIAVPGMPPGSPGMSGKSQQYSVIMFGQNGRRKYMQFVGVEQSG
jgi:hypothetical protein